jgi:L-lactate permease
MNRSKWLAFRLAVGDALLIVVTNGIIVYGLILLIFGLPNQKPTAEEILGAISSALPIFAIVWAILFLNNLVRFHSHGD